MKLLLGVTGGIAAYKACELTSLAVKRDHLVRVVMTTNACRFVGPLTFEALSGYRVMTEPFSDGMVHIEAARWADVICVAPMTANTLAKFACGIGDDVLSTTLLARRGGTPVVLGPAMNTEMWQRAVVQRNLRWLEELGDFTVVAPTEKRLACGDIGPGALADPVDLLEACEAVAADRPERS